MRELVEAARALKGEAPPPLTIPPRPRPRPRRIESAATAAAAPAAAAPAAAAAATVAEVRVCPFKHRRLDHVVLRCRSVEAMARWYIEVLGGAPEWLGRFGGALSHVRVGESLIDFVAMESSLAFANGSPAAEASALDHFALRCDDFDVRVAREWLAARGAEVVSSGSRYGADGQGFSLYVRDPEGNVVELKCGAAQRDCDGVVLVALRVRAVSNRSVRVQVCPQK